jgi:four helix bundle protein
MPNYQSFEELPAWKEAAKLYNQVLDFLENHGPSLSRGYRDQLDRASLSVSNNIAEGFERMTTNELLMFLAIARGSAGEVKSMLTVIQNRRNLETAGAEIDSMRKTASSCCRQITGWIASIEGSPIKGKRHMDANTRQIRQQDHAATRFRQQFLRAIKPDHPLYHTDEAIRARSG